MPGARVLMPFQPEMKNARLIQQTGRVSTSWVPAYRMACQPPPWNTLASGRPIM